MALLEARDLSVLLRTHRGPAYAVRNVSFTLEEGATLGLVGESGCGKSITAMALMGLLPENAKVTGSIRFEGQELVGKPEREMCRLRGDRIGMIFQEPMTALNPVHTIGHQVAEPLRLHRGLGARQARSEAIALLERVGIPNAAGRIDAYPHQFSGGQRQRITIAMALACGPDLLVADEPTTALDVTIQKQILALIRDLVAERRMALVLISHDLGVIAQNVGRTLVMYGGSVVEDGPTASVFANRMHPYTLGLFGARPGLRSTRGTRLATIPGTVPELVDLPAGCPFAGRCGFTIPKCHVTVPPPYEVGAGHHARCIRLDAVAAAKAGSPHPHPLPQAGEGAPIPQVSSLLPQAGEGKSPLPLAGEG
ncbi:MAG TPA: ABC transporter ATP-binding protein [Ramlibacter sp.]|uniref:ABC transporter ATP-binding protein n=1 Tax=Ramlibacter sp. TaxID=1917967 RepID=UPI002C838E33|nr:ABC transporter ATP-binding protein [Ramlibacter sp.]HVZ44566.1 ABC transporter ATP-binding protein [Ramlibacter sp.]